MRQKRLVDDTPTSKTRGVFIGLVELQGTAESENPLTSYLAGISCVFYKWHIEEHWQRTLTETYTDAKGRTQTRTRTESGWKTVASGGQSKPFYLKDDEGIVRIVVDGATINDLPVFNRTCLRSDDLYYTKGPAGEIANSTHQRRFQESALPLHIMLYVMGQARERQDIVAAEIAQDKNAPMFLVSTRTEKQISAGYSRWLWFWRCLGLVLATGATVAWGITRGQALSWPVLAVAVCVFLLILSLGWVWTVYNSLINLHHMVEQGWSQVDVQIKRRHDLIPNLTSTVAGYREHERGTQQLLAELRDQYEATQPGVPGPDYKGITPALRAIIEQYPDLKASEQFLRLQQSLVDTEQRIALARDYYNNIATFYNTRLAIIPDRFVATMAGLHPRTLMGAADFDRAPVEVKLAS